MTQYIEYKVQKDDNLSTLARRHNTSVETLVKLNQIADKNKIGVGQTLRIPSAETAPASPLAGEAGIPADDRLARARQQADAALRPAVGAPQPSPTTDKPVAGELIMARALQELGNGESGGDNRGPDVARYLRGLSVPVQNTPWCTAFVSYAVSEAAPGVLRPTALGANLLAQARQRGAYHRLDSDYAPQPGDLVFFRADGKSPGHIGIVVKREEDGTLHTIEGNVEDPRYEGLKEGKDYRYDKNVPDQIRLERYTPKELRDKEEGAMGFASMDELTRSDPRFAPRKPPEKPPVGMAEAPTAPRGRGRAI